MSCARRSAFWNELVLQHDSSLMTAARVAHSFVLIAASVQKETKNLHSG